LTNANPSPWRFAQPKSGYRRVACHRPCNVTIDDQTAYGIVWNLSMLGAYLGLDGPLPSPGELVRLSFAMPGDGAVINCVARVAWQNPASTASDTGATADGLPPGCGLEFLKLRQEEEARISACVNAPRTPVFDASTAPSPAVRQSPRGHQRVRTVLAVDDSPVALHMLKVLLGSGLHSLFLAANNGLAALDLLAHVPVDVILLDINMPVMNGFEFLQRVQEEPAYRSIPVIVISTEGKEQDFRRALAMGARAYLTKPFLPTQLVQLIDELAPPTAALS